MTDVNVPAQPAKPAELSPQDLQAQFNQLFGGRRNKRAVYRRWLKRNGVPRPLFAKVSDRMQFAKLNYLTFLDDLKKANEGANK